MYNTCSLNSSNYLGFSTSLRGDRRKRNPNDCYWLHDAYLCKTMFVYNIICRYYLNTVSSNFHWALYQYTVPALDNSFRTTGPRLMLPPKQTNMFLKNSRLFRRWERPKSFVTCHFQFFWILSYFKVTTFCVVTW